MNSFRYELEKLINRYSMENGSDTPDFILADYLGNCLANFDWAVNERERLNLKPKVEAALEPTLKSDGR